MAKTVYNPNNQQKSAQRTAAMEQGAYDGRFRNKIVQDKTKQQDRNEARKWKQTARQSYMAY